MKQFLCLLTVCLMLLTGSAVLPSLAGEGDAALEITYSVDRCDDNLFFRGHDVNLTNRAEGLASVGAAGDTLVFLVGEYPAFDPGIPLEEAYLEFWLYVSDLMSIGNSAFNVNSTGDVNGGMDQITFDFSTKVIQNGWNYISFPFSEGVINGNFDMTQIKQIRYYAYVNRNTYVLIDDISITNTPKTVTQEQIDELNQPVKNPVPLVVPVTEMENPANAIWNWVFASVGIALAAAAALALVLIMRRKRG